jgi:hypothetical protein
MLVETIQSGFAEMLKFAGNTARFGESDYDCIQAETQEIAELVIGGVDEDLDGALVFTKSSFNTGLPVINQKFVYGGNILRVATISTDLTDPTFTLGFTKVDEAVSAPALADPSIPCYHIDGGEVVHPC